MILGLYAILAGICIRAYGKLGFPRHLFYQCHERMPELIMFSIPMMIASYIHGEHACPYIVAYWYGMIVHDMNPYEAHVMLPAIICMYGMIVDMDCGLLIVLTLLCIRRTGHLEISFRAYRINYTYNGIIYTINLPKSIARMNEGHIEWDSAIGMDDDGVKHDVTYEMNRMAGPFRDFLDVELTLDMFTGSYVCITLYQDGKCVKHISK